mgnify:FL=1
MRIRNISLSIGGDEYKCRARSVELRPIEGVTLCTDDLDYELTAELELTYGATGTYNQLSALAGTLVEFIVSPLDGVAAATNPVATFDAYMPAIPIMVAAPNEVGTFELVVQSEGGAAVNLGA